MPLNPGTQIKFDNGITYEVEGFLGSGGQGTIYKAKNLSDNQVYALKILVDPKENRRELQTRTSRWLRGQEAHERSNRLGARCPHR